MRGFTLIELSVVLIIVALIAGGILLGNDMIASATIRATISQIELYNTNMHAFKTKYNALPGDMHPATAGELGMFQFTGPNAGTKGLGNNNGLIESTDVAGVSMPRDEHLIFWRHLSDAAMVDGAFAPDGSIDPATGRITANVGPAGVGKYLPKSKIGRNNYVRAYADLLGRNAFQIAGVPGMAAAGWWGGPLSQGSDRSITPLEAEQIDRKMDDGNSSRGQVRGGGTVGLQGMVGVCMVGTPQYHVYNVVSATGGNEPACTMQFVMH